MRRALLLSLACLCAAPAAAGAQDGTPLFGPLEYESAPAEIARGGELTFAVRTDVPAGSVVIRVSGTSATDDRGLLETAGGMGVDHPAAPEGDPALHVWSPPAGFLARRRPGAYYWQAFVDGDAATAAQEPVGEVMRFDVRQPASRRGRGRLSPAFGRRGGASFYLSSANFPAMVGGRRFGAVVGRAGRRWGLRRLRWTSAVAGRRDGFNVAGFSPAVRPGALGVQTDYVARVYRQVRRCLGASCTTTSTYLGPRIVEQDLALRTGAPWAAGPGYPALDEIDLESVALHELGHFAGNKRHRRRCTNSPLVASLGTGEWWRGPRDHWFFGCGRLAQVAAVGRTLGPTGGPREALVHRTVAVAPIVVR